MVRLKDSLCATVAAFLADFNSTMVRLKAVGKLIDANKYENFNSTMVRLKDHQHFYLP